jgi:hypothetical protein
MPEQQRLRFAQAATIEVAITVYKNKPPSLRFIPFAQNTRQDQSSTILGAMRAEESCYVTRIHFSVA